MARKLFVFFSMAISVALTTAYAIPAHADALFESDEPLALTLSGPFSAIRRDRDKAQRYPGEVTFEGVSFPVTYSVRGNKRLQADICRHPPLWLEFDKEARKDTLFDKQKRIKMVVLCRDQDTYRGYLRAEYLIYRMLNELTDESYKVRWVDASFDDGVGGPRVANAFFIERKARVAKRLDYEKNERPSITFYELEPESSALSSLFQYVIGNPDYSFMRAADPAAECCHNAKLFIQQGTERRDRYVPVPYDFDSSGLINAKYAKPNPMLGIKKVTTRLFRGVCYHNDATRQARDTILAARSQLEALVADDPLLKASSKKKMLKYLEGSFETLADPQEFEEEIIGECRR